jgi:hypothetical protein
MEFHRQFHHVLKDNEIKETICRKRIQSTAEATAPNKKYALAR